MIRSKLGLKALALSGLIVGLMAFATSSAQATVGANWKVNGKFFSEWKTSPALLPKLEIRTIENNTASLNFTTKGGTNVLILCTSAKFDEGGHLIVNGGISLGRILFKGCSTLLNEVASAKCKPSGGGTAKESGEILTRKGEGLIVLHQLGNGELDDLVLLKPDPTENETFAVIELGASCAIGESVDVKGELFLEDCAHNTGFLEEKEVHLIQEASQLHGLSALGQTATIIGSANIGLAGEHEHSIWKGIPA
jgi:hypothetical protein